MTSQNCQQLGATCWKWKGCQLEVTILADDQPLPMISNFPHVNHVDDDINQMTNNVVCHVRNDHPIIDGVGLDLLLMKLVKHWLVFIQVSITDDKGAKHYEELADLEI